MTQKTKLAIIGAVIAGIIVIPLFVQVTLSLLSLQRPRGVPEQNPLVISEMDSWLTYTDEDNGFSIKYPPEMYPTETPFEGYAVTFLFTDLKPLMELGLPAEVAPRIQIFSTDTPISLFREEGDAARNAEQFPEYSEFALPGHEAYQTKALDPLVIFTHTIIGNENKSYLIELFSIEQENEELRNAYEQMLTTFEIL